MVKVFSHFEPFYKNNREPTPASKVAPAEQIKSYITTETITKNEKSKTKI